MTNTDFILARLRQIKNDVLIFERLPEKWDALEESSRRARMLSILDYDTVCHHYDTTAYYIFISAFNAKTEELGVKGCDFSFSVLMDIFDLMERYAKLWSFS
jgi:hypothetical protein